MIKRLMIIIILCFIGLQVGVSSHASANEAPLTQTYPDMVIEWLKFKVDPDLRDLYLEKDAEIWTPALKQYPGFIDKFTWLDPAQDAEVVFVIRWETRAQWKAIPEADLNSINADFDSAFGHAYEMTESKEFYPSE